MKERRKKSCIVLHFSILEIVCKMKALSLSGCIGMLQAMQPGKDSISLMLASLTGCLQNSLGFCNFIKLLYKGRILP